MRPLSRPVRHALVGTSVLLFVLTWLWLVLSQPEDSDFSTVADSRSTAVALVGFLVPTVLSLIAVVPTLPVRTLSIIPVALVLNIVVGQVVGTMGLPLPLYLDSFGTVLVAVLAGPAAGLVTGGLSSLVWGAFNPTIICFAAGYAMTGFVVGLVRGLWRSSWWKVVIAGLVVGLLSGLVSAPVANFIFGGTAGTGTGLLVSAYEALGFSGTTAVFLQSWTSDPVDKVIIFMLVFVVYRALPQKTRRTFAPAADSAPAADGTTVTV
ncbi:MAG: ECF transporter S component [Corynebacterium provencense]|uniref:ECF transporter S component n=1 Tax=Corynebacterium provencense TaxID=1737425 RepID=UPI002989A2AC|nr:ECF transporter S component [Corynebacterium provencense]